jgi:hypothetical protein
MWPFKKSKPPAGPSPEPGVKRFSETFGDLRISLECAPFLEWHARTALKGLGARHSEGVPVVAGQRYDYGGMMFSIIQDGDGLALTRPLTPAGDAFLGAGNNLSDMLGTVAMQGTLARRLRIEPAAYTLFDRLIVAEGMHAAPKVYMVHDPPSHAEDSGWFIAAEGYAEGHPLQSISVLQLFRVRRSLLQAMLLPIGYLAFFEGDQLVKVVTPDNQVADLGPAD